jgi:hypothetical protein
VEFCFENRTLQVGLTAPRTRPVAPRAIDSAACSSRTYWQTPGKQAALLPDGRESGDSLALPNRNWLRVIFKWFKNPFDPDGVLNMLPAPSSLCLKKRVCRAVGLPGCCFD